MSFEQHGSDRKNRDVGRVLPREETADLRELDASGGWYRTENDLQITFGPLIGYKACWLYECLCRLIPLAQKRLSEGVRLDLTHAFLAKQSGLSKSQVQREVQRLVAVGMVRRIERPMKRCPTYQLMNLQQLAALGIEALKSRLGDPDRVSDAEEVDDDAPENMPLNEPEGIARRDDTDGTGADDPQSAVRHPARTGESGAPDRVTDSMGVKVPVSELAGGDSGSPVTQKRGVRDPGEGLFIKDKDLRQKDLTPLPPEIGGREISPIAMGVEATGEGNGESKNFPNEGQEQEQNGGERGAQIAAELAGVSAGARLEGHLVWATARVMRAHGFTKNPTQEQAIFEALELFCSTTKCTVEEAVALEAKNFAAWQESTDLMTHNWGPRWWFNRGYWAKPHLWPYDRQKLDRQREANVGKNPYQEGGE
jgi:hypothetical protein